MTDKLGKNATCPWGSRKKYKSGRMHDLQHDNVDKIMSIRKFWHDSEFDYKALAYAIVFFFISLILVTIGNKTLIWSKEVDGLVVDKYIRELVYISDPGSGGAPYVAVRPAGAGIVEKYTLTLRTTNGDSIMVTVPEEIFHKCELQKSRLKKHRFSLDYVIVE